MTEESIFESTWDGGPIAPDPPPWAVFCALAEDDTVVVLHDEEHDRFEWVSLPEAMRRCLPAQVGEAIQRVAGDLDA